MEELKYIQLNVEALRRRIGGACDRAGRAVGSVELLAVTKMRSAEEAGAAVAAGVRLVGENRVQEASGKKGDIGGEFEYHFIGHLQTNKAGAAVEVFDVVQSVDSLRLAEKLSHEAEHVGKRLRVYAQVNSSGEDTKSGFEPSEFVEAALEIREMRGLDLCGVMTIGPLTEEEREIRRAFAATRELFEKLHAADECITALSMGMSDDLEFAIAEGATLVRVGSAIFERGDAWNIQ